MTQTDKQVKQLDRVIIRFAGDSGDGMQLTGDRFTQETAVFGNDLVTLPNFPAEIRAPQGTLPGVSSFQVHFADHDILTAGDAPDVLVAMNPAALRANLGDLPKGATIIVDTHDFTARNLTKVGYTDQPARRRQPRRVRRAPGRPDRHDGRGGQGVRPLAQGRRAREEHVRARPAVVDVRPPDRADDRVPRPSGSPRCPTSATPTSPRSRPAGTSARRPRPSSSATRSSRPPMPRRHLPQHHRQPRAVLRPDRRRRAVRAPGVPRLLPDHPGLRHPPRALEAQDASASRPSRPRTRSPASVRPSARPSSASLGVTTTSGPGIALKSETIGLAVMTELPLVVVDVQRGGPSTGLPTKTEQADLLQAMFGRNGEAPVPIVAPQSPGDCFDAAVEAARIAVTYRTPVMLLSDGYLANGSEPWRIPEPSTTCPRSTPTSPPRPTTSSTGRRRQDVEFWPYLRDDETLARPWAIPGTPGSSTASAASRRATATATSPTTPPTTTSWSAPARPRSTGSPTRCRRSRSTTRPATAKVLVLGWGSTYGPIGAGVRRVRKAGYQRRAGPPAPPQPVPARPRRDPQALRQGAGPGDEPRPALPAAAREVPRRRRRLQPGPRPAPQGRRAGRRDRRASSAEAEGIEVDLAAQPPTERTHIA